VNGFTSTHGPWRGLTTSGTLSGHDPTTLTPLSVGELLDQSFDLLRDSWRVLFLVVGVAIVPVELVLGFLQRMAMGGLAFMELLTDPIGSQVMLEQAEAGAADAFVVQGLAAVTVFAVVEGMVARVGVSRTFGERLTVMQVVRDTLPRWPALIAGWFLALAATSGLALVGVLAVAVGGLALAPIGVLLVLLGLPVGAVAYTLFRAVPTVIVVERLGPVAALQRSATLLRSRFFPTLGVILLALLVGSLVEYALGLLWAAGGFAVGLERGGWVLTAAGGIAAGLVVQPFQALVCALLYLDARVRREGLDLEIRTTAGAQAG
jgi:hypothetical protein